MQQMHNIDRFQWKSKGIHQQIQFIPCAFEAVQHYGSLLDRIHLPESGEIRERPKVLGQIRERPKVLVKLEKG